MKSKAIGIKSIQICNWFISRQINNIISLCDEEHKMKSVSDEIEKLIGDLKKLQGEITLCEICPEKYEYYLDTAMKGIELRKI